MSTINVVNWLNEEITEEDIPEEYWIAVLAVMDVIEKLEIGDQTIIVEYHREFEGERAALVIVHMWCDTCRAMFDESIGEPDFKELADHGEKALQPILRALSDPSTGLTVSAIPSDFEGEKQMYAIEVSL